MHANLKFAKCRPKNWFWAFLLDVAKKPFSASVARFKLFPFPACHLELAFS